MRRHRHQRHHQQCRYRVNRYQKQFTLDDKINIRSRYEVDNKVDFIEECLMRNMDHCAEYIISLLDFEVRLIIIIIIIIILCPH